MNIFKDIKLDEYYGKKARGIAPIDEGIPIETLYGIKTAYDARRIIHAHNSDVREIHFHRHVDRAVKPFGMSYARIETRSTYHHNLGPTEEAMLGLERSYSRNPKGS